MLQRMFQNVPAIFSQFVDVGHYDHTIEKYQSIVDKLQALPVSASTLSGQSNLPGPIPIPTSCYLDVTK